MRKLRIILVLLYLNLFLLPPALVQAQVLGDCNSDGVVDATDYELVQEYLGSDFIYCDFDLSGIVDNADLGIICEEAPELCHAVPPNPPQYPTGVALQERSCDETTFHVSWSSGGGTTAGFYIAYNFGDNPSMPASCEPGSAQAIVHVVGAATYFKNITNNNIQEYHAVAARVCAHDSNGNISSGVEVQEWPGQNPPRTIQMVMCEM